MWLASAILALTQKCDSTLLSQDNSGNWWAINVWSRVFDDLVQRLPGIVVQRGKDSSIATLYRETQRDPDAKAASKFDSLLRFSRRIDFVAIEDARCQRNAHDDIKFEHDLEKMLKAQRDMLYQIHDQGYMRSLNGDVMKFQTLGILEEGAQWTVFGLQQRGNRTYLREHFRKCMPGSLKTVKDLLEILKFAARIYLFIQKTILSLDALDTGEARHCKNNMSPNPETPQKRRGTDNQNQGPGEKLRFVEKGIQTADA